jgi:hypothetical protein
MERPVNTQTLLQKAITIDTANTKVSRCCNKTEACLYWWFWWNTCSPLHSMWSHLSTCEITSLFNLNLELETCSYSTSCILMQHMIMYWINLQKTKIIENHKNKLHTITNSVLFEIYIQHMIVRYVPWFIHKHGRSRFKWIHTNVTTSTTAPDTIDTATVLGH